MINQIQKMWNEGKSIDQIAHRVRSTRRKINELIRRAKKDGLVFIERNPKAISFDNEILRLKYNECRFITNADMSSPIYCKAPISRVSYCEGHAALCFTPARKSYK